MNKGLEALKIMVKDNDLELPYHNTILTIEQELKAFEIIRNKRVDVDLLLSSFSLKYYNEQISEEKLGEKQLTREEYDLLKEVMLCNTK